jgi:hypothetical protein
MEYASIYGHYSRFSGLVRDKQAKVNIEDESKR